jgi:hypothetical protein
MADDCYNKITGLDEETHKKIFGEAKIPKEMLRRFVDDLEQMKKAAAENPQFGSFESRVNEYVRKQREFNKITKEVRKKDLLKAKSLQNYLNQEAYRDNPIEGMVARLTAATDLGVLNRESAEFKGFAMARDLNNFAAGKLHEMGVTREFLSGANQKNVWIETRALAENRGIGSTKDEVAMKIATVINGVNKKMFDMQRNIGIPLREMPEYVVPLTHDIPSIREAGEDAWVADMKTRNLDKKAMFGEAAGNSSEEDKILRSIYKGVTLGKTGMKTNLTVDSFDEVIFGKNLTKKLTESRTIRFLDAASEHDYNEKWGKANLSELFFSNIERKSRMMGLVDVFGSNPERMLRQTLSTFEASARKGERLETADMVKKNTDKVMNAYHEVSGQAAIPGTNVKAQIGHSLRMMNVLSKLWDSGLRSTTNLPMTAMTLKTYAGGNFFEHLGAVTADFIKTIPKGASRQTTERLGYFARDFIADMNASFGAGAGTGLGGKMARLQFKLNGMDYINNRVQGAFAKIFMSDLAEATAKGWDTANPRMQASMLSAGIKKEDFGVLAHAIEDMPDGRKMVTGEGIDNIPVDILIARVEEYNKNLPQGFKRSGKVTVDSYKQDLKYKFLGLVAQGAMASSTSAGARERAVFTRGTYKGTNAGEVLRLFGQFKTFWAQNFNLVTAAMQASPDEAKLARGILMSGKKDFITPAQFFVMATAFAYIGDTLIEASRGENPKDPRKLETWVNAMAKSGAGGLYSDMLFGDVSMWGMTENVLGPTFGQAFGPAVKAISQGRDEITGKKKGSGPQLENMATRLIRNNIPFQRAWGAKQALDYLQFDVIQESLTPGYKAKQSIKNILETRKNRINIGF